MKVGIVMGSDTGARGPGNAEPAPAESARRAAAGREGGRVRSAGQAEPAGAAPEGGGRFPSRPGRRAPLKWPQLHPEPRLSRQRGRPRPA